MPEQGREGHPPHHEGASPAVNGGRDDLRLTLHLTEPDVPALSRIHLSHPDLPTDFESMRDDLGDSLSWHGETFPWSPPVRALTVLILRHAGRGVEPIPEDGQTLPRLSSSPGQPGAILRKAIIDGHKICGILGFENNDTTKPLLPRLIVGSNGQELQSSDWLQIDNNELPADRIDVYLGETKQSDNASLKDLAEDIESLDATGLGQANRGEGDQARPHDEYGGDDRAVSVTAGTDVTLRLDIPFESFTDRHRDKLRDIIQQLLDLDEYPDITFRRGSVVAVVKGLTSEKARRLRMAALLGELGAEFEILDVEMRPVPIYGSGASIDDEETDDWPEADPTAATREDSPPDHHEPETRPPVKLTPHSRKKLWDLYKPIAPRLTAIARARLPVSRTKEADDVVNDVFLGFAKRAVEGKLNCLDRRPIAEIGDDDLLHYIASCRRYLAAAVLNRCRDFYRSNKREVATAPEALAVVATSHKAPELTAIKEDERVELREAILNLPVHLQEAVVLRYYGGWKLRDIAEDLGKKLGTIKRRLHDARMKIAESLRSKSGKEI